MPRKMLRKILPHPDGLRAHRLASRFGGFLGRPELWHLDRESVAGGFAIGLFAGLIPGPFQMLGAILLAALLRRNIAVAVFTTLYTNPFTIVPLYALAYGLGALLLGRPVGELPVRPFEMDWSDLGGSLSAMLAWIGSLGKPLAVGLPALALGLAVLGYAGVRLAWRAYVTLAWRARRRAKRT